VNKFQTETLPCVHSLRAGFTGLVYRLLGRDVEAFSQLLHLDRAMASLQATTRARSMPQGVRVRFPQTNAQAIHGFSTGRCPHSTGLRMVTGRLRRPARLSAIHPDLRSAPRWNLPLSAMREDDRTNNNGGSNDQVLFDGCQCLRSCCFRRFAQGERAEPRCGRNAVAVRDDEGCAFASGRSLRRHLSRRRRNDAGPSSRKLGGPSFLSEQRAVIGQDGARRVVAGRAGDAAAGMGT
jgi:hypothetical protein